MIIVAHSTTDKDLFYTVKLVIPLSWLFELVKISIKFQEKWKTARIFTDLFQIKELE